MKYLEFELFVENYRVKLIIFASFRSNYILFKNMAAKLVFRSPPTSPLHPHTKIEARCRSLTLMKY
jgi:hypothetical protein